jgi:hypothetical protein
VEGPGAAAVLGGAGAVEAEPFPVVDDEAELAARDEVVVDEGPVTEVTAAAFDDTNVVMAAGARAVLF